MIRYWYRLENLDSNFTLLKDAYEESKKLFEIKIPSWYGSITLLIKILVMAERNSWLITSHSSHH
jgi:hypothetical protein